MAVGLESLRRKVQALRMMGLCLFLLVSSSFYLLVNCDDGGILLEIKKSFRDVNNVLYDWTDSPSSDYCMWRGVSCDNVTFNVLALNLSDLNLDGELSPSIGQLKGLLSIDLRANRLSGQIPDEIGDCSTLKNLDLSFNMLTGDIPFSVSKLKQLELLVLKDNQLTGPIPTTLSQIPNLKILDLAQNRLSGEIPRLIYWNEVLQYLGLRSNNLVGELSPDICQLTGLWYFDVRNNSLSGTMPSNIGNCTGFQVLDLSYNRLTGDIPFNIGFLQVATLSLQGNQFSGEIPSVIGLMQALTVLDLSCNNLTGQIPPILGNLTYTEKLYLHNNKLTGSIPPELGNMSKLHYLELNDNQLTGHIPPELGKLTDLFDLNVAGNKLEGHVPQNLSSCTNLNSLNMHGNRLKGTIPAAFQRLESMTYLNLSSNYLTGPIPIELSRIGNLDTLDLSNNKISGSIPSPLGDLEHLLKLNLSRNELTGYLPAEFGNLRSVMEIDLSYNHLSGVLPQELGQLQNLFMIKLESNNFTGSLVSLVNCLSLSVLNISYNNLVGEFPSGNNLSKFPPDSFLANPGLCSSSLSSSCHASRSTERVTISKAAILGIALGALVLLLMILVAVCWPHRSKPFIDGSYDKPVFYPSPKLVILHMNMALHVYDDIMRMTENLSEKYIIRYGASSTVYKCVLKNCRPVAIQKLHTQYPEYLKEFETELETVGSIKHRNLVSLQGYSLSPSGNLLFYDYMENGSLWDLLHGPLKKKKLDWDTRVQIALGAAQGLAYLHHDCSPRIIHRDVKSSNILLDKDFEAHLTDFGIAKSLCTSKTFTSTYIMGTIGYIDPEYARTSRLTEKSDVYSYGIVLLELLTGRKAVDNESNLHHLILSKTANNTVMETVDPEISATCKDLGEVKKVFQLALLCTKRQPFDRPTMHKVVQVLGSLLPPPKHDLGSPAIHTLVMQAISSLRNLEFLTLGKGQLGETFFQALTDCTMLKSLIVTDAILGNGIQEIPIYHDSLQHIQIVKCRVVRISVRCPQLQTLSLKRSSMAHAVLNCPLLHDLDIASCHKLLDAAIRSAVTSCPLLESLDMSNCSCVSDETLREISTTCGNLHILNASYCPNISLESVRLPMLTVLKLHSCEGITSASMAAIAYSYMLEVLELDNCSLLTSVFLDLPRLQNIRLVHCRKFVDLSLRSLVLLSIKVSNCPLLQRINIVSNSLQKLVLQKQESLTCLELQCQSLQEVDLTDCESLTNSICEVFSDGSGCPMLKSLILDNCESLTAVEFCSNSLTSLSLAGCRGITSLELTCPYLEQVSLDGCDHLERAICSPVGLRSLNLGICPKLNTLKIEAPTMVLLELKGCGVLSEASINCPLLTSLDASFCSQLKDDCLSATTASCPLIESLILMSCTSVGSDGLASLRRLPNLTSLDLSYTFLTNLQPVFDSCLQLKVLKLQACKYLTDSSLEPLYKDRALPTLRELDLSYGSLCQAPIEELLACCTHLTHVSLNGCVNMHDLNWSFSADRVYQCFLQNLNCVGCPNIKKVLIPSIAHFSNLSSLNMSLSAYLKEVDVACSNLCFLNLSNCSSLEILKLDCPRLTSLFLQSCNISEAAVESAISHCNMLETLDVRFCQKISPASVGKLRTACPSLKRIFSSMVPV